jgi:hypothetical protein
MGNTQLLEILGVNWDLNVVQASLLELLRRSTHPALWAPLRGGDFSNGLA